MAVTHILVNATGTGSLNSIDFNGSTSKAELANKAAYTAGTFSVDFWMKAATPPGAGTVYNIVENTHHLGGETRGFAFYTVGNTQITKIAWGQHVNGWQSHDMDTGFGIYDNQWHHIAVSRKDNNFYTTIDGVDTGTFIGSQYSTSPGVTFNLGYKKATTTDYYLGSMDGFRYYDVGHNTAELQALYNNCSPATSPVDELNFAGNNTNTGTNPSAFTGFTDITYNTSSGSPC